MDKHRKKTTKMQEGPLKIYSDGELTGDEKDTPHLHPVFRGIYLADSQLIEC